MTQVVHRQIDTQEQVERLTDDALMAALTALYNTEPETKHYEQHQSAISLLKRAICERSL